MTAYARQIATAKRLIQSKGAAVSFTPRADGSGYNAATDTFSGSAGGPYTSNAIAKKPDADTRSRYEALKQMGGVLLLVEAADLNADSYTPKPGDSVSWNGSTVSVEAVETLAVDGTPILHEVVGLRA